MAPLGTHWHDIILHGIAPLLSAFARRQVQKNELQHYKVEPAIHTCLRKPAVLSSGSSPDIAHFNIYNHMTKYVATQAHIFNSA
jgi:hypothetical protein